MNTWVQKLKPFILVAFLQLGLAGMDLISKAALNDGTSNYVLIVYRHAVATVVITPFAIFLNRRTRSKMTLPVFIRLMALGLLETVIDQNLYYLGIKHTTVTFGASMSNVLPAMTFVMACILRLETVNMRSIRSQAKVFGTLATVAAAMIMTLVKRPNPPDISGTSDDQPRYSKRGANGGLTRQNSIKGALMITSGMFCWSCFMILQAVTLPLYPTELSLTASICFLGTVEGAALAVIMEKGNAAVWSIHWDAKLLAAVYSGIVCSGLGYYVQGVVMKERGPVFVTAFNPLSMVTVAVLSTFILAEHLTLGRVIGATVIMAGLYLVIWGKSKDNQSSNEEKALPSELADPKGIDEETARPSELADPGA